MLNKQNYPVNMGRDYVRGGRGREGRGYQGGEAMEDSQEDSKAREAGTQPVQAPNNPR